MGRRILPLLVAVAACGSQPSRPTDAPTLIVPPIASTVVVSADAGKPAEHHEGSVCTAERVRARLSQCGAPSPTREDVIRAQWAADADARRLGAPGALSDGSKPRTLTPALQALFDTASAYLCEHRHDVEVLYSTGRTMFTLQHWDEAVFFFGQAAFEPATEPMTAPAAQMYLEAANVLATKFGRSECADEMRAVLPKIRAHHCTPAKNELCKSFAKIEEALGPSSATR